MIFRPRNFKLKIRRDRDFFPATRRSESTRSVRGDSECPAGRGPPALRPPGAAGTSLRPPGAAAGTSESLAMASSGIEHNDFKGSVAGCHGVTCATAGPDRSDH